jgi:hypothetical protein
VKDEGRTGRPVREASTDGLGAFGGGRGGGVYLEVVRAMSVRRGLRQVDGGHEIRRDQAPNLSPGRSPPLPYHLHRAANPDEEDRQASQLPSTAPQDAMGSRIGLMVVDVHYHVQAEASVYRDRLIQGCEEGWNVRLNCEIDLADSSQRSEPDSWLERGRCACLVRIHPDVHPRARHSILYRAGQCCLARPGDTVQDHDPAYATHPRSFPRKQGICRSPQASSTIETGA